MSDGFPQSQTPPFSTSFRSHQRLMAPIRQRPLSRRIEGVEAVLRNDQERTSSEPSDTLPVKYLFVNVSNPSQPPQSEEQNSIKARVQRVAFRKRNLAAIQRLRTADYLYQTRRICQCSSNDAGLAAKQLQLRRKIISARNSADFPEICPTCGGQLNPGSKGFAVATKPRTMLGEGRTDPFATISAHMTDAMYAHLHHCRLLCTL
jgi:hypothetical protein